MLPFRFSLLGGLLVGLSLCVGAWANEGDRVLHRVWVPNGWMPQGEVRLLDREGCAVVQTVLWTKHLPLVVGRIVGKERKGWGEDPSAKAYIEALESAAADVAKRADSSGRTSLLIEFVAEGDEARVVFGQPSVRRDEEGLALEATGLLRVIELPAGYIQVNQERILADSFGREAAAAIKTLARFRGPLEAAP